MSIVPNLMVSLLMDFAIFLNQGSFCSDFCGETFRILKDKGEKEWENGGKNGFI